jgi:UDP-glucose 4-epimerase
MKENNVFKLIFSSSAAVYNDNQPLPLKKQIKQEILKIHMAIANIL